MKRNYVVWEVIE